MAWLETPGGIIAPDESEFTVEIQDLGFGPEAQALYERLSGRIIGQDRACKRLARAFSVQTAGLGDVTLPAGTYLFAGPTGVGKTMVAEEFSRFIVADTKRAPLTRIPCGSLKKSHEVSRLAGAPPGYVGNDKPALLSQLNIDEPQFRVRAEPHLKGKYKSLDEGTALAVLMALYRKLGPFDSVILFDEIEKAHEDFADVLLHVLDDGEFSMADGSITVFSNSYIILTCNVGEHEQQNILRGKRAKIGYETESPQEREDKDALIYEQTIKKLEERFPAALVGRLRNEFIIFRTLDRESARKVLDLMLDGVRKRVDGRVGSNSIPLTLHFSDSFKEFLLKEGYDRLYGMRPMRKTVYKYVTSPLANGITNGELREADVVLFTMSDDGDRSVPVLRRKPRPQAVRISDEEAGEAGRATPLRNAADHEDH